MEVEMIPSRLLYPLQNSCLCTLMHTQSFESLKNFVISPIKLKGIGGHPFHLSILAI